MNRKLSIYILGSGGQLGQTYAQLSDQFPFADFIFFDRKQADITNLAQLQKVFASATPDYVINCAAYTAVDKAESEVELATLVNNVGCKNLDTLLSGTKAKIIHFSTDYVYHGDYQYFPIMETDMVAPKGVYAQTKLDGENILLSGAVPTMVLRTSWVISPYGNNFVKTMMKLGVERSEISVVNDQFGAPTLTEDLVRATMEIILIFEKGELSDSDWNTVYNFASEGIVTWYEMATLIMKSCDLGCAEKPIASKDYPTQAKRPHWSVMSKHKIKNVFGLTIPHWRVSLLKCIDLIKSSTFETTNP
jgi:dTDP-4-dehydrorhamnose reductase